MKLAGRGRRRQELPTTPLPILPAFPLHAAPQRCFSHRHSPASTHPIPAVGSQRGLEPRLGPAVGCGHRGH